MRQIRSTWRCSIPGAAAAMVVAAGAPARHRARSCPAPRRWAHPGSLSESFQSGDALALAGHVDDDHGAGRCLQLAGLLLDANPNPAHPGLARVPFHGRLVGAQRLTVELIRNGDRARETTHRMPQLAENISDPHVWRLANVLLNSAVRPAPTFQTACTFTFATRTVAARPKSVSAMRRSGVTVWSLFLNWLAAARCNRRGGRANRRTGTARIEAHPEPGRPVWQSPSRRA